MRIDKEVEYESLRQEILDSITAKDNYIIAMYTITTAILCVAFELKNPILFLLPYIIIFAFQYNISAKSENMIILAAYISVFLEGGQGWESDSKTFKDDMRDGNPYKKPEKILKFLVGRIGSVQLGMLCSVSCVIYSLYKFKDVNCIINAIEPAVYILLSTILYVLLRVQTRNVLKLRERKENYVKNLQRAKDACELVTM